MRHRLIRTFLFCLLAVAALVPCAGPARAHGGLGMSLYDQLGGVYGIAPLVDDFVDRLWRNPVILANPHVAEARGRYAKASLRFLITEYLCDKTGGPMVYRGRDLKTAHAGLRISQGEWKAMIADLEASMRKFSVPMGAQADLIGIFDQTKNDIVTAPAPDAPSSGPVPETKPGHDHAH